VERLGSEGVRGGNANEKKSHAMERSLPAACRLRLLIGEQANRSKFHGRSE
jgi:hypothetical protein